MPINPYFYDPGCYKTPPVAKIILIFMILVAVILAAAIGEVALSAP